MATLYLSEQQSIVKKRDGYLIVQYADKRTVDVPLIKVSQVVVSGDVTLTTPALHTLLEMGIEVCFLSMYGHFRGRLSPPVATSHENAHTSTENTPRSPSPAAYAAPESSTSHPQTPPPAKP